MKTGHPFFRWVSTLQQAGKNCGRRSLLAGCLMSLAIACTGCQTPGESSNAAGRMSLKPKNLFDSDIAEDEDWQQKVKHDRFPSAGM